MEVHHPHHVTHKKKWFEYLLEFFMLFLAVFLGFVAENIREHIAENNREKEYVQLFIEDLQNDSLIVKKAIPQVHQAVKGIDTLINQLYLYIDGKADTRIMYYTYHHYVRNWSLLAKLSERTIEQLKSSGNMRLIRNKETANIISDAEVGFNDYDEHIRTLLAMQQSTSELGLKIFDFKEYEKANTDAEGRLNTSDEGFLRISYQPPINVKDTNYLKEFAAKAGYYRNLLTSYSEVIEKIPALCRSLISTLKKDYHLE